MSLQPLAYAWIEIISLFKVEGMARFVVEVGVAVGNSSGNLFSHPHGCENIVLTSDHEAGRLDFTAVSSHIVPDAGCRLTTQTVKRLGHFVGIKVLTALQKPLVALLIIKERLGENQQMNPLHELLIIEMRFADHHVAEDTSSVVIATRPGAHQNGTLDLLRMTQAKLLGNN